MSALVKASVELSQIGLKPEAVLRRQQTSTTHPSAPLSARKTGVPKKEDEKAIPAMTVSASLALSPPPTPAAASKVSDSGSAGPLPTSATSADPRLRARAQAQMRRLPELESSRASSPPSLVPSSVDLPRPAAVPATAPSGRAAPPFPVRKTPTPDPLWLTRPPASVSTLPASTRRLPLPSSNTPIDPIAEESTSERPTVWMSTPASGAEQVDPPEIADSGIGVGLGIDFGDDAHGRLSNLPDQSQPASTALSARSEQDCPSTAPPEESDCVAQSSPPAAASQGTEEDEIKLVPVPSKHEHVEQLALQHTVSPNPTPAAAAPPTLSTHRLSAESSSWYSRTNICKPFSDLQSRAHVQLVPKPMAPFEYSRESPATAAANCAEAPAPPVSVKATSEPYKPFSGLTPSPPRMPSVPAPRSESTGLNGTPTRLLPLVLDEMLVHTPGRSSESTSLPAVSTWYEEPSAAEDRATCGTKRSSPEAEEIWPAARRAFNPDRIGKGENVMLSPLVTMSLPFDEPNPEQEEQSYRFEYQQYLDRHLASDLGGTMATPLDWAIAAGWPMADPPRETTPEENDTLFGAWQPSEQMRGSDFASSANL